MNYEVDQVKDPRSIHVDLGLHTITPLKYNSLEETEWGATVRSILG